MLFFFKYLISLNINLGLLLLLLLGFLGLLLLLIYFLDRENIFLLLCLLESSFARLRYVIFYVICIYGLVSLLFEFSVLFNINIFFSIKFINFLVLFLLRFLLFWFLIGLGLLFLDWLLRGFFFF